MFQVNEPSGEYKVEDALDFLDFIKVRFFYFKVVLFEKHFRLDFNIRSKQFVDFCKKASQPLLILILNIDETKLYFLPDVIFGRRHINHHSISLDGFGFFQFFRAVHFVNWGQCCRHLTHQHVSS
jgi:hypothetical protein